jgi:hypothetical protein
MQSTIFAGASLIVGTFQTGGQSERSNKKPYPFDEQLAEIRVACEGPLNS